MLTPQANVNLYIENPQLCAALVDLLTEGGFHPVRLDDSLSVDPTRNVVLLETNDDVAHLNQIVQRFYFTYQTDAPLPLIAFLSEEALERNPMLRYWLIDGRAAVMQIVPLTEGGLSDSHRRGLLWLLRQLVPLYRDGI